MPRSARQKSNTDIYHIILRGVNRQYIFEEEEDYDRFLFLLGHYKKVCGFQLYAWCLMPNHIHLLMKEGRESVSTVFRRLGTSFVYWYNLKYGRTGHLFQDRFKSESVEDDAYFLTVLRYIHLNPVKAGLCGRPEDYPYSSYSRYFDLSTADSDFVRSLIGEEEFHRYHEEAADDICMDISETIRIRPSDEKLKKTLNELYSCDNISQFQALSRDEQAAALRTLLREGGSIRQVSRLTGSSFSVVRKYT